MKNARLLGIDAGRFLAICCVALIHVAHDLSYTVFDRPPQPSNEGPYGISAGDIIQQLCRFAVPFFFLASGYFNAPRRDTPVALTFKKLAGRILPVFLFWSILYNLISPHRWDWFTTPSYIIRWVLNGGAGDQLWFLPALLVWMTVALLLRRTLGWTPIIILAAILYALGLCLGAYQGVFLGHTSQILVTAMRDGPSFGLVFILIGMWVREHDVTVSATVALTIFIAGAAGQLAEAYGLNEFHILAFFKPDFTASTLVFGTGALLLALAVRKPSPVVEKLAFLGQYTLGIYALHRLLVQVFGYAMNPLNLGGRLEVAALAVIVSTLVVLAMSRIPALRFATA
jgi:surface polysaccharide O-acyltransferase-like enzyme